MGTRVEWSKPPVPLYGGGEIGKVIWNLFILPCSDGELGKQVLPTSPAVGARGSVPIMSVAEHSG